MSLPPVYLVLALAAVVLIFSLVVVALIERLDDAEVYRAAANILRYAPNDRRELVAYRIPGSSDTVVELATVYERDRGCRLVPAGRTTLRGYTRQLAVDGPGERRAANSRAIDVRLSQENASSLSLSSLVECRPNEDDACDNVVNGLVNGPSGRLVCTTIPRNLTVSMSEQTPDPRPGHGWCLPLGVRDRLSRRNCNPLTGSWLLTLMQSKQAQDEQTVRFAQVTCRCRYPNLMTQSVPEGDCDVPVGCRSTGGELDEWSRTGRVDPYVDGRCVCPSKDMYSSFDRTVGPICRWKRVNEMAEKKVWVKGESGENDDDYVPVLPQSLLSRKFQEVWNVGQRSTHGSAAFIAHFPDPCRIDMRDGKVIVNSALSCRSAYDDAVRAVKCVAASAASPYQPIRSDTDYLLGNHGRYENACMSVVAEPIVKQAVA